ncbi:hypothetical protein N8478_00815 [bacterium]|nr:hypothetical protein [bacterium]
MKNTPIERINHSLRTAAVKRNAKTALFLGVAASGAIVSTPVLAVTAMGSLAGLYVWDHLQKR